MSLRIESAGPVPKETVRVARAAFPKGNVSMQRRDVLGVIYADETFSPLFAARGRPAECPWRLARVRVRQFAEGLSDRQAAEAVRARIDWKYALGLVLDDAGFDYSVLCEFRARLLEGSLDQLLLEALLAACRTQGLLRRRGRQRTASTHVLGVLRLLNRLDQVADWTRSPRRCGRRWTRSRMRSRTGSWPTRHLRGSSATADGSRSTVSPKDAKHERSSPARSGRMACVCSPTWPPPRPRQP